jgi:hypothetical protein
LPSLVVTRAAPSRAPTTPEPIAIGSTCRIVASPKEVPRPAA